MAWTAEDYKRLGMSVPAQPSVPRSPVPTPKPPPRPQPMTDVYRNALARRLRESGVE